MKDKSSNNKKKTGHPSECIIESDGHGHFFCRNCGEEYISLSATMLYMTVYAEFRVLYLENNGLVEFETFVRWLGKNMDKEQIVRTFHYLKRLGLVSKSADGKYLKNGVGQEADQEHRKALWRAGIADILPAQ